MFYEIFKNAKDEKNAKKLFAIIDGEQITYSKLSSDICKTISLFQSMGLKKQDKMLLSSTNDYFTSLLFLTSLYYGITTVFLDPSTPVERAKSIIEKSNIDFFAMDDELFEPRQIYTTEKTIRIKQKQGKLLNLLVRRQTGETAQFFPALLNKLPDPAFEPGDSKVLPSDIAYIIYTSGTTAAPKGVTITFENLWEHLATLSKVYRLSPSSKILNLLALYHADGCIQGPLLTIFNLATWIRAFKFSVPKIDSVFHSIYKYQITHFITVPTMLSFLHRFMEGFEDSFATEEFETVISVASKLEKQLWNDFENSFGVKIINVYGLTETVAGSIFCAESMGSRKVGTIGKPVDCEAKIIKNEGELNEEGVLLLKGKHITPGYYGNDEATKAVIDDNGWLNTGDIATMDDEGFITIVGRQKNTINFGGFNIYPEQISETINRHEKVSESICLGMPDEDFGEKVVVAVVPSAGQQIDKLELLSYAKKNLEPIQVPKEVYFFEEFQKGLAGKVQLDNLRQQILTIKAQEEKTEVTNFFEAIKKAASQAFNVPENSIQINDTSNSIEGWDSMGHLIFITNLEERFGLRFSTAEVMIMNSISSANNILKQKLHSPKNG